jgi:hypothetical protein
VVVVVVAVVGGDGFADGVVSGAGGSFTSSSDFVGGVCGGFTNGGGTEV